MEKRFIPQSSTSEKSKIIYSIVAFGSALAVWCYGLIMSNFDLFHEMRFLTIWALTFATIVHGYIGWQRINHRPISYKSIIQSAAIMNILVVFLYWRLYLINPSLVNGNKTPSMLTEYYLHSTGPLLMVIEALFLSKAFINFGKDLISTLTTNGLYIVWAELVLRPLQKLPYPFLAKMYGKDLRLFYIQVIAIALFFHIIMHSIAYWLNKYAFKNDQA